IINIDYSMINIVDTGQTGLSLYNCIEGDPFICTYSDDDVNLVGCIMEGSPCIDRGRGNLYDEDGTISDMGAIPTVVDVKECEGNHWNWESFPRVGELNTDISDNISDILDMSDLYPYDPGAFMQIDTKEASQYSYYVTCWYPERTLYSAVGYKVKRFTDDTFYIPLEGYRLSNTYQFNLPANTDKWLGYWIPETRNIVDAFSGLWDHVTTIYAEDWCYKKPINGFSTPSSVTTGKNLEYGKMYIIITDISTYWTWDPPGGGGAEQNPERETPKYFYFADQPDYLVIDVLDIDEDVEEIGVFQGTTCIGASVVESESVQILAYIDPELRDEYELSFQLISEDRNRTVVENCWVYNENNGEFGKDRIRIDSDGYILLSLEEDYPASNSPLPGCHLYQNYPNPFNPETNIRFYLSMETSGAELTIYNIRGQEVKNYDLDSYMGGREHVISWKGRNNRGNKVSSGIYFYRLNSDQGSVSNKMVLMK
ncbi:MAG: T9SS type A sorting domain-containing protein, partial [Candidatus Stygibacter australis]|nr:T9SS type A sorting domain-containing protein [Candidatus Stygibacter australis]